MTDGGDGSNGNGSGLGGYSDGFIPLTREDVSDDALPVLVEGVRALSRDVRDILETLRMSIGPRIEEIQTRTRDIDRRLSDIETKIR